MNKEKRLANMSLLFFAALSLLFLVLPMGPVVGSVRAIVYFATYPFIRSAETATEAAYGIPHNIIQLLDTEAENRTLREQQRQSALLKSQLDAALEENARLSAIASFAPRAKWNGQWAHVIERDPAHWYASFTLDRGSVDGVSLHDPVLGISGGKAGLLGKIIEVSRETSKVLLLTDDMFSVTCYVQGGNWDALAEGQGRELMRLNYLPGDLQLERGVEVLTSQASVVFPPGVSIGTVVRMHQRDSFVTFASADIMPTVRPGQVKEVFIMKRGAR